MSQILERSCGSGGSAIVKSTRPSDRQAAGRTQPPSTPTPDTTLASLTYLVILKMTVNVLEISVHFNPGERFLNLTPTEGHKLEL